MIACALAMGALAAPACASSAADPDQGGAVEGTADGSGVLVLRSVPSGAYVYVDGSFLGLTPITSGPLEVGPHRVWFRSMPPMAFEPEPVPERTIDVAAGDTLLVEERLGTLVRLDSDPQDAEIVKNGRVIGHTPLITRWRERDREGVRIRKDGYHAESATAERLRGGGDVVFTLRPVDAAQPAGPVTSVGSARLSLTNWMILGASAASVGLAIYYKDVADDAYAGYERSAIPADMSRLLDRADRYDGYAAIAWAAAETGLVVSAWLLTRHFLRDDVTPVLDRSRDRTGIGLQWRY